MIDPRGQRFAAWITSAVLAVVLLTGSAWLLLAQAVVFALGATGRSPYGEIWKRIPKSPPKELEDKRPPQFAEFAGQEKVCQRLELMVQAAKQRGEALHRRDREVRRSRRRLGGG